jgi:uncharacterized protein
MTELILVGLATFAGAVVSSATGFGFALVLSPALFAVLEPAEAITTILVLSAVLSVLILYGERRRPRVRRREFWVAMAWSVPGLVAGVFILLALSKPSLQVFVGVAVLAAVGVRLYDHGRPTGELPLYARPAAGFAAGALTTTTGTNGPPLILMLERLGVAPAEFRDTIAALFLALDVAGTLALLAISPESLALPGVVALLVLLLLVALGRTVGRAIFERLNAESFRIAVLCLIVANAFASIVAGLAG